MITTFKLYENNEYVSTFLAFCEDKIMVEEEGDIILMTVFTHMKDKKNTNKYWVIVDEEVEDPLIKFYENKYRYRLSDSSFEKISNNDGEYYLFSKIKDAIIMNPEELFNFNKDMVLEIYTILSTEEKYDGVLFLELLKEIPNIDIYDELSKFNI